MVCLLRLRGNTFRRQSHVIGSRSDVFPSGERESGRLCLHQDAALPLSSITFRPLRRSCWRRRCPQSGDQRQDFGEHLSGYRNLSHLESDVAPVVDDLRANLDQLLLEASQRHASAMLDIARVRIKLHQEKIV
jgi:hypothetical protein